MQKDSKEKAYENELVNSAFNGTLLGTLFSLE